MSTNTYAIVANGTIDPGTIWTIVSDTPATPLGFTEITGQAGAVDGASLVNGAWSAPAPIPAQLPDTVALWKIKIVLSEQPSPTNAGKTLLDDANAAVAAASIATQIAWTNAAEVALTSPTLAGVAAALGMQTTEVATLYAAACAVSL